MLRTNHEPSKIDLVRTTAPMDKEFEDEEFADEELETRRLPPFESVVDPPSRAQYNTCLVAAFFTFAGKWEDRETSWPMDIPSPQHWKADPTDPVRRFGMVEIVGSAGETLGVCDADKWPDVPLRLRPITDEIDHGEFVHSLRMPTDGPGVEYAAPLAIWFRSNALNREHGIDICVRPGSETLSCGKNAMRRSLRTMGLNYKHIWRKIAYPFVHRDLLEKQDPPLDAHLVCVESRFPRQVFHSSCQISAAVRTYVWVPAGHRYFFRPFKFSCVTFRGDGLGISPPLVLGEVYHEGLMIGSNASPL